MQSVLRIEFLPAIAFLDRKLFSLLIKYCILLCGYNWTGWYKLQAAIVYVSLLVMVNNASACKGAILGMYSV